MAHPLVDSESLDSANPLASLIPGIGPQLAAATSFLAALLLATIFAIMLYGLSVHQAYRYFQTYTHDTNMLKGLVLALFILDTVHTAFSIDSCYFYLVTNYFNPLGLGVYHISLKVIAPITGCNAFLCQFFYARRVYNFGVGHRLILVVAGAFMLAKIGFVIVTCIKAFGTPYLQEFYEFSRIVSAGSFGCDLVADIILTTTLVIDLLRSRTGFRRTDNVIEVLIMYTVNTGLVTSIVAILVFVFGLATPNTFVYGAISIVSNKVYFNAVMAVLNSRHALSMRMGYEADTARSKQQQGSVDPSRAPTTDSWFAPQRRVSITLPEATVGNTRTGTTPNESSYTMSTEGGHDKV